MSKQIPLSQGLFSEVDDEDFDHLSQFRWHAVNRDGRFYACRHYRDTQGQKRKAYMHRVISNAPKGKVVDHINGDGLDNRRGNLRLCTTSENMRNAAGLRPNNKSGFMGVSWSAKKRKWLAQISHKRRTIPIGFFDDPVEAAKIRDEKAKEIHGEFAFLNFPKETF